MPTETSHLPRRQIIRAAVDATDLPESARQHLDQCPECQTRQKQLHRNLEKLSRRAAETVFVPLPRTAAILAGEKPRRKAPRTVLYRRMLPALSTAALLLLLVTTGILSLFPDSRQLQTASQEALFRQIEADEAFAAEIASIEDYALAGFTRQTEAFQYTSEEFIDFVAPLQEAAASPDIS